MTILDKQDKGKMMKNIIKVDTRFQKAVNLTLDIGDMYRVNQYIPTRSSLAILKKYLENVRNAKGNHATVLIGPYGKGKSHLLLVLLALLCSKDADKTENLRRKMVESDASIKKDLDFIVENKKPFLPVIISSFQGDLNQSFIFALQGALKKEGIMDIVPESEYTEALKVIDIWKRKYPNTYEEFQKELKEISIEEFIKELKNQKEESLLYFREIYPLLTSGSQFMPILQKDALKVYEEVNRALCEKYKYSGIYIIFDEFSKYIEGHEKENFSKDMKILQDMCELSDSKKEEELYITFVAHKSIHEYVKGIDSQVIQAFRGVEGRLKEIQFVVSSQNNYELIENALKKEPGFFTEELKKETEKSYKLPCFSKLFKVEDFVRIVARGCYPLTPVCAYALLNISEKIGQNERTVFTFLTGNEPESLLRLIEHRRMEELLGIDCVYDYFKNLFKETVDQPYVHKEWLKADYALTKAETEEEKKIIKAIAIIRMIRRPEEITVQKQDICCSLNMKEEEYEQAMRSLIEKKLVFFRKSFGIYDFKNNIGIDIESVIEKEMGRLKKNLNICKVLNEISELTYALPKQYNQNWSMTRYFRYEFINVKDYLAIGSTKVFFDNHFCDGYILALVAEEKVDKEEIISHLQELNDERIIVLFPKEKFVLKETILKLSAVRSLAQNEDFIDDNKVLFQELDLYEEDIRYEINEKLKRDFMPEREGCFVFHTKKEKPMIQTGMEFTRYLSEICEDYYSMAPRINHELLNIQNVQGQYLRARNEVVEAILDRKDLEVYAKSSSSEAMVYRAAFVRTGVSDKDFPLDVGCRRIMKEIDNFFVKGKGNKVSFSILYDCLQGRDYGVRKGILPLFLAWKICLLDGMPVIYLGNKELDITVDVLNNINQFPESYEIYIEETEVEKELYLKKLEEVFWKEEGVDVSNRFFYIMESMQKWYRSLSQFTRTSENYPKNIIGRVKNLRKLLKQTELNPREFLFEQLIFAMDEKDYQSAGFRIEEIKKQMDGHLEKEVDGTAVQIKKIFSGKEKDSLKACLLDWYMKQSNQSKQYVLDTKIKNFMEYLRELQTNDEREIIYVLSKRMEDIYVEDWNDKVKEKFIEDVTEVKKKVEKMQESLQSFEGQKEILLKSENGQEIRKFYDADTEDSTSEFLKNMIEEVLENFGDSLETNQKVAVLAETLEKLLQ